MAPAPSPDPDIWLDAADRMLAEVIPGARGVWPRACAWLIRLALETELTRYWQVACPPVARSRSRRAQFLLLPQFLEPAIARRAHQTWSVLSRAGHHHSYELGLTGTELSVLKDSAVAVIAAMRSAAAPGGPGEAS